MAVVEESIFIAQPASVVFDYLSTAESLPIWTPL